MKYKGEEAPKNSGTAGVKQFSKGINRGKWAAFYRDGSNLCYTGPAREHKGQALLDLTAIRARIYV